MRPTGWRFFGTLGPVAARGLTSKTAKTTNSGNQRHGPIVWQLFLANTTQRRTIFFTNFSDQLWEDDTSGLTLRASTTTFWGSVSIHHTKNTPQMATEKTACVWH